MRAARQMLPTFVCLVCLALGCGKSSLLGRHVYDREELQNQLHKMKPDEVRAKIGEPDRINTFEDIWIYKKITRDPKTGEVDSECRVCFGGTGRVVLLNWPLTAQNNSGSTLR